MTAAAPRKKANGDCGHPAVPDRQQLGFTGGALLLEHGHRVAPVR